MTSRDHAAILRRLALTRQQIDVSPWRCVGCGTCISPGFQQPCKCIPNPDPYRAAQTPAAATSASRA